MVVASETDTLMTKNLRTGSSPRRELLLRLIGGVAVASALAGVAVNVRAAATGGSSDIDEPLLQASAAVAESCDGFSIELNSTYTAALGHPGRGYRGISEGMVVEPHRETVFIAQVSERCLGGGGAGAPAAVHWVLRQGGAGGGGADASAATTVWEATTAAPALTTVQLPGPGTLVLVAEGAGWSAAKTLLCRYVRRELRQLTAADREGFFDAFAVMLNKPGPDGRRSYGSDYLSVDELVATHLELAGGRRTDRLHDGLGFLTQHVAMTAQFERALQSVAPEQTVPYWDFTLDAVGVASYPELFAASPVWGPSWFGRAAGVAAASAAGLPRDTVVEGRWAYQRVGHDYNSTTHNPYGFLRAPWNLNRSPFLTRVGAVCGAVPALFSRNLALTWPTCSSHADITEQGTSYDAWYEYAWKLAYVPHGPVHLMVGGYGGCGEAFDRLAPVLNATQLSALREAAVFLPKNLWRYGWAETPGYCAPDTPQADCALKCSFDLTNRNALQRFRRAQAPYGLAFPELAHGDYARVANVICDIAWVIGEQAEAGSPSDISFWPMHPTIDRLTQYRRAVAEFSTLDWAAGSSEDESQLCQYGTDCAGHHGYDLTSSAVTLLGRDGAFATTHPTNAELLRLLSPADYKMSYIYQDFDYAHCRDADGSSDFVTLGWNGTHA